MEEAENNPGSGRDGHVNNRKTRLSASYNGDLEDSYFNIRLLLQQLRPHFIQVLRTTDFRNCRAAHEIQKNLKVILDLYKQMIVDTEPQTEDCVKKSTDIKDPMCCSSSERNLNDGVLRGSYIVGGSVLGSNFITYGGGEPVYYGITKESYLSRQMKSIHPD
ncbi:hypothetical protein like AT1G01730 [Hibiscus trionum]|uniref:Uncharacterized protein n=1 Tax=Hibiscus trionum TaxID=183268 RepID=A0A9W7HDY1_HIBTR|nr:hypothetical protein like AT1G01730 [Hibiscus trionum]